jgi:predicted DNA-binding transcriptional regulator YafY
MSEGRTDSDRRLRQAFRIARVLRVLELIQSKGRWNAKTIAAELECSERTIHRDRQTLELAGVPLYHDKEENCYRVRSDYRFPVLNLTEEEALGQGVATAIAEGPGLWISVGGRPMTRKLSAVGTQMTQQILSDVERLVHVLDLKIADHSRHLETLRTAQRALLDRKQLIGQYRSPYEPGPTRLQLHPYRLCLIKAAWYVIGRPEENKQPRTFRIARFKSLGIVDRPAEVPEGFDLKAYFGNAWAVYRGDRPYDVEIRFAAEAAEIVTETRWHHTQQAKRHKDGSVTITFQVDGLNEIIRWVVGWAGQAKVIKPRELRDMAVERFRKAIRMNESKK